MSQNLILAGNTEIKQFVVTESGLYAWRNKIINGEWIIGSLKIGDRIDDQFEGCGPIKFLYENR